MNDALLQALVRFGRTVGGYAVALALESLAGWLGLLELDPVTVAILTPLIGGVLNALAKWLRGPDVPVADFAAARVRGLDSGRRQRGVAFFLPF